MRRKNCRSTYFSYIFSSNVIVTKRFETYNRGEAEKEPSFGIVLDKRIKAPNGELKDAHEREGESCLMEEPVSSQELLRIGYTGIKIHQEGCLEYGNNDRSVGLLRDSRQQTQKELCTGL